MKAAACLLILASLMWSCSNNPGSIEHTIKYTTSAVDLKSGTTDPVSYYTDLGDYITSITPVYFGSKINILMYLDQWNQDGASMISYIDGHDNDPNYEIAINVDFSKNQETTYAPILYGDLWKGLFRQKEITFDYFYFVPYYFEQEFEVPAGYGDMLIMGHDSYTTDPLTGMRLIKFTQQPFLEPLFGVPDHHPWGYFFGNTESTYVFNRECADLPASEDSPNGGTFCMIRSHHYTPITVTMPDEGETIEMYSTISFDTEGLIQVYAGLDNMPYTYDDIFVYAPNYWERLKVRLEVR